MFGGFAAAKITHGMLASNPLGMITNGILVVGVIQGETTEIRRGGGVSTKTASTGRRVNKDIEENKHWIRVYFEMNGKRYSRVGFHNKDIKIDGSNVHIEIVNNKPQIKIDGIEKITFYPNVKIKI